MLALKLEKGVEIETVSVAWAIGVGMCGEIKRVVLWQEAINT